MNLIRTILIILLIYYGFKIISRMLAPFIMKKMQKKMEETFNQGSFYQQQEPAKPEGEVTIMKPKKHPNKKDENHPEDGEYIDYEEV